MNGGGKPLVYISTRKCTAVMAHRIANEIGESLTPEEKEYLHNASEEVLKATSEPTRICKKLAECLNQGVAFHHAGLHYKQRKIVEDAFRKNKIKALVSTTTLAMGLNLPSRRVIIKDWYRYASGYGMKPIPILEIKQMSGRAGRPKYDNYGEAIIIASDKKDEKYLFENYLRGIPEWIESQLGTESSLRTHILSSIAGFFARTEGELQEYIGQTFFAFQR
ncbi:helicase [Candidatus Hakubella thermalkaliphila]|uniref:Helicase n=1 Tax=Candidatus Hakubella thermalkaliphila TaxID=2754717 RepID=A0A6V8PLG8_9ACTN|nr:helicase [Candidatus Hakubella thermalkaliphila]